MRLRIGAVDAQCEPINRQLVDLFNGKQRTIRDEARDRTMYFRVPDQFNEIWHERWFATDEGDLLEVLSERCRKLESLGSELWNSDAWEGCEAMFASHVAGVQEMEVDALRKRAESAGENDRTCIGVHGFLFEV